MPVITYRLIVLVEAEIIHDDKTEDWDDYGVGTTILETEDIEEAITWITNHSLDTKHASEDEEDIRKWTTTLQ